MLRYSFRSHIARFDHRGPAFASILRECVDGLRWAFQTQHDMLVLTTSGTGGLESLVANTLRVTAGVVGFVVGLLAIIVIAAYLVVDARTIGETLLRLVLAIGMALLGVKYALLIGALVSVPLLAGGWQIVRRLYLADD